VSTSGTTRTGGGRFRPNRRPPARYHHGDLRQALIDAALHLIERRGPERFTLREAARLVGVTHTAPYRHFPDKSALLAAVALEGVTGMREAMIAATGDVTDPLARLEALGVAYVSYAVSHPSHFRVMYGTSFDAILPELADAKRQTLVLLLEVVGACQAAGALPASSPQPVAVACWSMVHGLATLLIEGTIQTKKLVEGSTEDIAHAVTRVLITGASGKADKMAEGKSGADPKGRPRSNDYNDSSRSKNDR
jgi:AcrR family transcriptional regulator